MRALLLLLALVVGCSAPRHWGVGAIDVEEHAVGAVDRTTAHWTIGDEFSAEETEQILAAADAWRDATGRVALTFEIGPTVPDAPWTISRVVSDGDASNAGETTAARDAITLNVDIMPSLQCVWLAAAHELGHTFRLEHGGEIMRARQSTACDASISAVDVGLFAAANAVEP